MGATSGDIERQIAAERQGIEARVIELRTRGTETARRYRTALLVGGGVVAGVGITLGVVLVMRRVNRPHPLREQLGSALPHRLLELREALGTTLPAAMLGGCEQAPTGSRLGSAAGQVLVAAARSAATALAAGLVRRALRPADQR